MICKICNKKCKNWISLGAHISKAHKNIIVEKYYNLYLKKSRREGKCKICRKLTKFMGLSRGYLKYCSIKCVYKDKSFKKEVAKKAANTKAIRFLYKKLKKQKEEQLYKIKCELCNKKIKAWIGLVSHIRYNHPKYKKNKNKKYFDKFIFNKKVGVKYCLTCNKPLLYKGIKYGYGIFCSSKCRANHPKYKQQHIDILLNKCNFTKASKVSQELFSNIYDALLESLIDTTYYSEINKEFGRRFNNKNYFYDFIILKIKFCIEFNGTIWHADPRQFVETDTPNPFNRNLTAKEIWEYDKKKMQFLENEGYEILIFPFFTPIVLL